MHLKLKYIGSMQHKQGKINCLLVLNFSATVMVGRSDFQNSFLVIYVSITFTPRPIFIICHFTCSSFKSLFWYWEHFHTSKMLLNISPLWFNLFWNKILKLVKMSKKSFWWMTTFWIGMKVVDGWISTWTIFPGLINQSEVLLKWQQCSGEYSKVIFRETGSMSRDHLEENRHLYHRFCMKTFPEVQILE